MLNRITPDDDELPLPIELERIDNTQTGLAAACATLKLRVISRNFS